MGKPRLHRWIITGILLQLALGAFLGHHYDTRIFMVVGKAVAEGQSPYSTYLMQKFLLREVDVIHIHQFKKTISNMAAIYGKLLGKKIFVTDHGGVGLAFNYTKSIDGSLAVSEYSASMLSRYGKRSTQVIHGGVDLNKFQLHFQARDLRFKLLSGMARAIESENMKVGLIDLGSKELTASFPHLGLGYIAGFLRKNSFDVCILDLAISRGKEIEDFPNQNFDLVGITVTSATCNATVKIASKVKAKTRNPNIKVVFGGPHIGLQAKNRLSDPQLLTTQFMEKVNEGVSIGSACL